MKDEISSLTSDILDSTSMGSWSVIELCRSQYWIHQYLLTLSWLMSRYILTQLYKYLPTYTCTLPRMEFEKYRTADHALWYQKTIERQGLNNGRCSVMQGIQASAQVELYLHSGSETRNEFCTEIECYLYKAEIAKLIY